MTGPELRAARLQLGLTQRDMAELLGLAHGRTSRSYTALENGRRRIQEPLARLVTVLVRFPEVRIFMEDWS